MNSTRDPRKDDDELKRLVKKVSDECQICLVYRKAPYPGHVVGLPMPATFQECVTMDLKFYNGNILLHLVNHAIKLSSSKITKPKEQKEINDNIFKIWIQTYGAPEKFLTDNGGDFANRQLLEMCEAINITVNVTAAESPFSNVLVKRHNMIIANMLDKILEDQLLDLDIALPWCLNANKLLVNIHLTLTFSWSLIKTQLLQHLMANPQFLHPRIQTKS